MRVKKQLISVGKSGIKPSHVRSLNSLVAAHTLVKVKVCLSCRQGAPIAFPQESTVTSVADVVDTSCVVGRIAKTWSGGQFLLFPLARGFEIKGEGAYSVARI